MTQQGYRIAVIIPVYNREKYVRETLDSVEVQTRVPDEIIVVDDGSTDGSVDVVKQWQPSRAPAVKLIEQQNRGAAAAMNVAIEHATSDLIAPLDSDDVFLPGHLARLEDAFVRHPDISVCSGNSGRLDNLPHGKKLGFGEEIFQRIEYEEGPDGLRLTTRSAFFSLLKGAFIPTCSTLFSKQLAEQVGLYDESLSTHYDQDFWMRMSRVGRFGFLMEKLSLVRKHDDNLTSRKHIARFILNAIQVLEGAVDNANQLNLAEDELNATRVLLAKRVSNATNRASRYGLQPYLAVCRELLRRGHPKAVLPAKPLLRAIVFPFGNSPRLKPVKSGNQEGQPAIVPSK